ncbi:hypothetical protein [Streptomyces sp. CMB-StM0423]|uniref:hypothetical protein n=1 Tax=Streptomyces sp. CMB-StM0423 TaxID=2059884 RepID=UPI001F3E4266|nr:hypothetical protein [Streptomyces sp. CMB-StM0423]
MNERASSAVETAPAPFVARSDRRRADTGAADLAFGLRRLDPSRQPQLAAIGDLWPERSALDRYPQVLRIIVDGLLAEAGRTV